MDAEFEVSSQLGTAEWRDGGRQYDAVTCMFALHYFFASERSLQQMLHNVAINLKPGAPPPPSPLPPLWPSRLQTKVPPSAHPGELIRCKPGSIGASWIRAQRCSFHRFPFCHDIEV